MPLPNSSHKNTHFSEHEREQIVFSLVSFNITGRGLTFAELSGVS